MNNTGRGCPQNKLKQIIMDTNFTYYRNDIKKWLFENYKNFRPGDTPKEYAMNAVRYHNSKYCRKHCRCLNENHELITPRLSIQDKKWFKEVVADIIYDIWKCNTYIGLIRSR